MEKALGGAKIDVLVHSLANGPEVAKPLLETSRNGYLAAVSASSYSYVSMLQRFGPLMNKGKSFFCCFCFPFFFRVEGGFDGEKKHSLTLFSSSSSSSFSKTTGGAAISLTYLASEKIIPGYGAFAFLFRSVFFFFFCFVREEEEKELTPPTLFLFLFSKTQTPKQRRRHVLGQGRP